VRDDMFELLNCLDMLHREALHRMVELVDAKAPQLKVEMANDYAIQSVMMLYGFVPDDAVVSPSQRSSGLISFDAIPVNEPAPIAMPIWMAGGSLHDLADGVPTARKFEEHSVLLLRLDDEVYALKNQLIGSPLPLAGSTVVDGHYLLDPFHGERYDARTGEIQNGSGQKTETYAVLQAKDGQFRVGFNIPAHMWPARRRNG
jgi:nitrite reductase/ring-hydroxylating ferredoxin subunit